VVISFLTTITYEPTGDIIAIFCPFSSKLLLYVTIYVTTFSLHVTTILKQHETD